jgi:hypothetical protein
MLHEFADSVGAYDAGREPGKAIGAHQAARAGGYLKKCESPDCTTVVLGSGFCIECERRPAPGAETIFLLHRSAR